MFRSSEAAMFILPRPQEAATPLTLGDPLNITYESTLSNLKCQLRDGVGALVGAPVAP